MGGVSAGRKGQPVVSDGRSYEEETAAEKQERNVGESISVYYPVEVQQHEMQPKQCDQDGIQSKFCIYSTCVIC